MNRQPSKTIRKIFSPFLLAMCLTLLAAFFYVPGSEAASAKEIDVSVEVALKRFYKDVDGAKEFGKTAKGFLVMPNVIKAGFIVGGEYGEGALRIKGKTVEYYNMAGGSFGFQIGAEKKDIIIVFMTEKALNKFRFSAGWEAGVDGNIAIIDIGGGKRIDTTTYKDPIVAFIFDVKGLMADISLKGSKFTRLNKGKK